MPSASVTEACSARIRESRRPLPPSCDLTASCRSLAISSPPPGRMLGSMRPPRPGTSPPGTLGMAGPWWRSPTLATDPIAGPRPGTSPMGGVSRRPRPPTGCSPGVPGGMADRPHSGAVRAPLEVPAATPREPASAWLTRTRLPSPEGPRWRPRADAVAPPRRPRRLARAGASRPEKRPGMSPERPH
jgi:hypothetical protein